MFPGSPISALRCIPRNFTYSYVRCIPRDLRRPRILKGLELFALPSQSDFLRMHQGLKIQAALPFFIESQNQLLEIKRSQCMKFFIDTANVEEIREAKNMGMADGVTTNPSLIAKEGRDFKEIITE